MADSTSIGLLERLRQPGQSPAWPRFVDLYTPLLHFWARRLGLGPQDAEDLVQEVLTTLLKKMPKFTYDPQKSFRGWLHEVFRNKWRDIKRRRVIPIAGAEENHLSDLADPGGLAKLIEDDYGRYVVRRALELMQTEFQPATWKACWECVVDGKPAAQVAKELKTTANAVYLAKSRVLRRLHQELKGLLD